jgi:release factor glutamine methyltransferase
MKIYPSVFSPELYISSRIFTKFVLGMENLDSKNVLEMGCGSGIISLAAASKKAKCTAVDINPEAVKSTKENFRLNGADANVIESNLFEKLDNQEKYDIIFFNPPYYNYEPKDDFERAFGGGKDYRVIRSFLQQSKNYLSEDGFMCIIISSDMGIDSITSILIEYKLGYNILHIQKGFFETFYIIKAFFENT